VRDGVVVDASDIGKRCSGVEMDMVASCERCRGYKPGRSGCQLTEQDHARCAQRRAQSAQYQALVGTQPTLNGQAHAHATDVQHSRGQHETCGIARKAGGRCFGPVRQAVQ
jgi:hypothetical protein